MRVLECSRVNLAGAASCRSSQPVGSLRLLTFFLLGAALGAALLSGQGGRSAAGPAPFRPATGAMVRMADGPEAPEATQGTSALPRPFLSGLFPPVV